MKPEKQNYLIDSFFEELNDEKKSLYKDIIMYLNELGYALKKERSGLSFKHTLHNKQIVKIGSKGDAPFFALRFSACSVYSQRFADIIASYMIKYPSRIAKCIDNKCDFCKGKPDSYVYKHSDRPGLYCGAYAIEITDFDRTDLYEAKHEANIS